jgi:hypothetical protein
VIHNDAMVIEVNIAGWIIGKVLVDNGSLADILFLKTFEKMNLSQHMLQPPEYPLQRFGGKPIKPVGKISLPISFGDLDNARTENLTFDVVNIYHPYLTIFWQRIHEQIRCSHKAAIPVYEDTRTQGGHYNVRQSTRGQKHRKRPHPWPGKCVPVENS